MFFFFLQENVLESLCFQITLALNALIDLKHQIFLKILASASIPFSNENDFWILNCE